MVRLEDLIGFDWDEGNRGKNWESHGVTDAECEQPFFNVPLLVAPDLEHSQHEDRHYALGRTNAGRRLFVAFTLRGSNVRIISARDMTKQERRCYPL